MLCLKLCNYHKIISNCGPKIYLYETPNWILLSRKAQKTWKINAQELAFFMELIITILIGILKSGLLIRVSALSKTQKKQGKQKSLFEKKDRGKIERRR